MPVLEVGWKASDHICLQPSHQLQSVNKSNISFSRAYQLWTSSTLLDSSGKAVTQQDLNSFITFNNIDRGAFS